jgi:uncharacterized membrane-anchored protein
MSLSGLTAFTTTLASLVGAIAQLVAALRCGFSKVLSQRSKLSQEQAEDQSYQEA